MGPLHGSIIRSAARRDAVEGDECLTRPESGEPLARHPVAPGGGVVHLHGVGSISTSNHDEVTSLDPDQRWQWELGEFGGIPSHRKDPESGATRSRSQISQRGAARLRACESTKTVRRRHGQAGELKEVRQRRGSAVVERRLETGSTLCDESCASPFQRPASESAQRLQRISTRRGEAECCQHKGHEHTGGKTTPPNPQTSLQLEYLAVQLYTLCSWKHMSVRPPSPQGHHDRLGGTRVVTEWSYLSTTASASISTSIAGSINARTSTIRVSHRGPWRSYRRRERHCRRARLANSQRWAPTGFRWSNWSASSPSSLL